MNENHTIHLNNMVRIPRTRFANKVLFAVRNYVKKHTRAEEANIRISNEVNAAIYARGIQHKLNKIDVAFKKKDDLLYVFLQNGKELKAFNEKATKKDEKKEKAVAKKEEKAPAKADATAKAPAAEKKEVKKETQAKKAQ
jgi:ribosomal protein L31E